MAFVNEFSSKKDIEKYELKEPYEKMKKARGLTKYIHAMGITILTNAGTEGVAEDLYVTVRTVGSTAAVDEGYVGLEGTFTIVDNMFVNNTSYGMCLLVIG